MCYSLDDSEGLERQLCYDLTLEMSADKIQDCNHEDGDDKIAFHGIKHHLLTDFFQLIFNCVDFLFMRFILGLDNVSVFELFKFFIELLDLTWVIRDSYLW